MKGLKWLLIVFIGTISVTGFSSTTDLTEDSIVVCADVDVGEATLVDLKFEMIKDLNLKVFSDDQMAVIPYRYQALNVATTNHPKTNFLIPWQFSNKELSDTKFGFNYRSPRDSLTK